MTPITETQFAEFLRGYITAALWSTTDDRDDSNGDHLDKDFSRDDLTHHALTEMTQECRDFADANAEDLRAYAKARGTVAPGNGTVWDHAGHDFWLTSAGHGAGFWDRGLGDLGDRLSAAARNHNTPYLFVNEEDHIEAS